jgi:DNA-binding NtrC family response regulator
MKTILVIEDDDSIRSILAQFLRLEGMKVLEYCTCYHVNFSYLDNVELILCDVNTPILHGIEFFQIFKERYPDSPIPFVFFTGDSKAYNFILKSRNAFLLKKPLSCLTISVVIEVLTSDYYKQNRHKII